MTDSIETKLAKKRQQLARTQNEIAQLNKKMRARQNGEKIIIGGMFLAEAKDNPEIAKLIVQLAQKRITRKTDIKRVASLLAELSKIGGQGV